MSDTAGQGAPAIGFLGLGAIGRPMAERIAEAGHKLTVYDVRPEAMAPFRGRADCAGSVAEVAAGSDIVFACLAALDGFREIVLGPGGLAESGRTRLYVHTGTTGSALVRDLSEALGAKGIQTLDAPMTGGVPRARRGALTVMASGPSEAFALAEPIMRAYAGKIVHLGERPGAAQAMKLINNMLSAANLAIACEAMVLGAKAGLDPEKMIEVLNEGTGQNSATLTKIPDHVLTRGFDYGGAMYITAKDLTAFAEEAAALAVPTPLGAAVRRAYQEATAQGSPKDDITAILRYFERAAGIELPQTRERRG